MYGAGKKAPSLYREHVRLVTRDDMMTALASIVPCDYFKANWGQGLPLAITQLFTMVSASKRTRDDMTYFGGNRIILYLRSTEYPQTVLKLSNFNWRRPKKASRPGSVGSKKMWNLIFTLHENMKEKDGLKVMLWVLFVLRPDGMIWRMMQIEQGSCH